MSESMDKSMNKPISKSMYDILKKVYSVTDKLAGVCFFCTMALVLANIILRNVFRLPILGTVEIVGLLIATGLGLALANCELNNGNIAMDVVTEKLPQKSQKIIELIVYIISLIFWAIADWRIFAYAYTSLINGRVTPTTSIPIFPFIFILGINILFLCVTLAYKLICIYEGLLAETGKPAHAERGGN